MFILPREILFLSQVFGMFPLQYTTNTKGELNIEFSLRLFAWSLILIPFLSVGSYYTLFLDLAEFFNNGKSHVSSVTGVVAAIISNIPPNVMIVVFSTTAYRNYPKYIEMSQILEKIDNALQLNMKNPRIISFKLVFTYVFISTIIGISFYKDFHTNPILCSNSYLRCFYYFQATLLMHFTFVVETINARFKMINEKIKEEVLRPSIHQLMTDLAIPNSSPLYSEGLLQEQQIEILIDSYYQLTEAVEMARCFFENQLFATITCSFINNTTTLYYFTSNGFPDLKTISQFKGFVIQGAWVFSHITHITSLFWPSTALSDTMKETAQIVSQLISWGTNSAQGKTQLEAFLYILLHNDEIGFTGLGMFKIQSNVLISIASSVTTFLVIMLQI